MGRTFNQLRDAATPLSSLSRTPNEFPPRLPPRDRTRRNTYCKTKLFGIPLWFFWTLLLIAILALILPVAIMFGKKKRQVGPPTVLVPLYIYPDPGAWDPLFSAVEKYPKINFTIIINPNSGPEGLDGNYTRDIPPLNFYPNVRTVGYVSTNYTNRNFSLVEGDIRTYASWAGNASMLGMGMRGIFLDEVVSGWSDAAANFYAILAAVIRDETGLGRDPLIIHNPGTLPDARYLTSRSSNVTVIFENSWDNYNAVDLRASIRTLRKTAGVGREALAAIIYDVPDGEPDVESTNGDNKGTVVGNLRNVVGSLYLTGSGVGGDIYAGFWTRWGDWVEQMAS
ncbi:related to cell surface spherulin 4-like protein [Phialocephala subalpina]|uniref:Related to cell surface spherulin 4-like protein n=1 Tax=Phialocephala subalpina TaxID=576137 RepID=A0A1L7WUZ1_9HELO|nr:related to cell surface spherulin 4-like protein [Phialocephala subalpina]